MYWPIASLCVWTRWIKGSLDANCSDLLPIGILPTPVNTKGAFAISRVIFSYGAYSLASVRSGPIYYHVLMVILVVNATSYSKAKCGTKTVPIPLARLYGWTENQRTRPRRAVKR